jgi:hypothetical protein
MWLDASQLPLANGAAVAQWPDLSGQNQVSTLISSPAPVVRSNAVNGKPVVRFKVNEGRFRWTATGVSIPWTVVYVGHLVAGGYNSGRILNGIYTPNNILIGFWNGYEDVCYDAGFTAPDMRTAITNNWKMYSADGVVGLTRLYSDGVLLGTTATGLGFGGTLALSGYDPELSQETCDCEVAEVLLYNRCLSDAERQRVESYLRAKWFPPPFDADTVAYLNATGLDQSYAKTLDNLVVGLKNAGLWQKMLAIYPFIGGTALLHRWNLKDPRDLDAAYRLTFNSAAASTHSTALGYRANEQNQQRNGAYADTHLVPLGTMNQDSLHLSWYSTLDVPPNDRAEMGCFNWSVAQSRMHILCRYQPSECYYSMNEDGFAHVTVSTSAGLFVSSRTTPSAQTLYINGASVDTSPGASIGLPNVPVWVGGINSFANRTDIPCGFASIGSGLTAQNAADLYAVVQTYQAALRGL